MTDIDPTRALLDARRHSDRIARFNADDDEQTINLIPNASAWEWYRANVPLFECPDETIENTYAYRWWCYRKHIKQTPAGRIVTEFILPVRHAGSHNSISCATGFHIAEGRWLRDQSFLDEYVHFWFRASDGKPEPKFHNYSSWIAQALWDRYLVTGDQRFLIDLLDELVVDYAQWEQDKLLPSGLFWQFDVRDGMEESITGSRKHKNARPTINSYMFASARAIAEIATRAGRSDLAEQFGRKSEQLRQLVHDTLWDDAAGFFKAQKDENGLSDAREAIGYVPWCFNLPQPGLERAWAQLTDPEGFWAPKGLTTAERRHPQFRSHGVGHCEWDGAAWPFATSQTLNALANVLRHYPQSHVDRGHYLQALHVYAAAHTKNEKEYIGEYHDEVTGEWLKGDNPRSSYYNHSTFADLVIGGLVGFVPREDGRIEVDPLMPADAWDYFVLDGVMYHGRRVSIVWDRSGSQYHCGAGLSIYADGRRVAHSQGLQRLIEGARS